MLCVDCQLRPVIFRRTLCLECLAGKMPAPQKRAPYRPEDHAGKRAALRAMIDAARKGERNEQL